VGDIAKEAFLAIDETGEALGHSVDGAGEEAEFIAAVVADSNIEPALGDARGGGGHLADGTGDAADKRQPEEEGKKKDPGGSGNPRGEIEDQSTEADRL
jgi:hypothetical protein